MSDDSKNNPRKQAFLSNADQAAKLDAEADALEKKGKLVSAESCRFQSMICRNVAASITLGNRARGKSEFDRIAQRVSIGISQGALQAVERLGYTEKKHLNAFLGALLEEAIFALDAEDIHRPPLPDHAFEDNRLGVNHTYGVAGHFRLNAERISAPQKSMRLSARLEDIAADDALRFALASLEHGYAGPGASTTNT